MHHAGVPATRKSNRGDPQQDKKPEQMRISGKGTIKIVYDAEGNKLQKIYTAEGSSISKTTTYINQFVYEGDNLQYINFEEGRIRVITPTSQNNGFDGLSISGNLTLPIPPSGAGGPELSITSFATTRKTCG